MKANAKKSGCLKSVSTFCRIAPKIGLEIDHLYKRNSFRSYNSCDRMGVQHCLPWSLFKWWHHVHHCNRNTVINVLQYKQQSTWETATQLPLRRLFCEQRPPCQKGLRAHWSGSYSSLWAKPEVNRTISFCQHLPTSLALLTFWLSHFIQVHIFRSAVAQAFLSYLTYIQ